MLPRNLTIICVALVVSAACHLLHRRTKAAMTVGEAMEMIDQFYVDPVDDRELLKSAMDGMTSTLDQHSQYIPPQDYRTFQDSINQEFAGIGIYVEQPDKDSPVRVITPLVGSPALRAGILPGDQIMKVDEEDVSSMEIRAVSERLRGPIGTTATLLLKRGDEEVTTFVTRDRIEIESVIGDHRDVESRWVYRLRAKPNVAYIRMTSFGDKTVRELENVLKALNNDFDALVLDLRGNGGGLLTAAVDVADMFLAAGRIVSTKTRGGIIEEEADATSSTLVDADKPMAVLIDHDSASASEIVAAALQDHGRAIIGGTRSFGKGTVQNILPLEYGRSALRLTVAKYYRPSDQNIHRGKDATETDVWGVTPDDGLAVEIEVPKLRRLMMLWQEASYPSLKGIDRGAAMSSPPTETTAEPGNSETPVSSEPGSSEPGSSEPAGSKEKGSKEDKEEDNEENGSQEKGSEPAGNKQVDAGETTVESGKPGDISAENDIVDLSTAIEAADVEIAQAGTVWELDQQLVLVVERMLDQSDAADEAGDGSKADGDGEPSEEAEPAKKAA